MGRTIVIIEDNPADAKVMRLALSRTNSGVESILFEDSGRAIEYLTMAKNNHQVPADLILLDLHLPRIDGMEVLQFLKSDDELRKIPVVVLSGSNARSDVERSYAAYANSYICKPTGIDELFEMVQHMVTYWFEFATVPRNADALKTSRANSGSR